MPSIAELLVAELDREMPGTRRALERVPEGQNEWKPHEKSMPLGYLATLVATMPAWIDAMVNQDQLDFAPKEPSGYEPPDLRTSRDLVEAFDAALSKGRAALQGTTDEHLKTTWRLLAGGHVVQEQPRYIAIGDGVLNHWAHHRGQLSVYLRLNDVAVPSIYGPTADEAFGR
jgi:uncharacterized damage-inducible protein DinB